MRVGWLADRGNQDGTVGGAEMTAAEFRAAAPADVEIVDCPPGAVPHDLDRYVVHNCVDYRAADLVGLEDRCVKYLHDLWPHGDPVLQDRLLDHARLIYCGPAQARAFERDGDLVPPAVDLARFTAADGGDPEPGTAVAVGPWMNPGKAPWRAAQWAQYNGVAITFVGGGPFAPTDSRQVPYAEMPNLLATFEFMVHRPTAQEPFGRAVVEAWAAGCEIVCNHHVGAWWWITEQPDELETAGGELLGGGAAVIGLPMSVGFAGLGKLGLPVAYAMAARGLRVHGHDPVVTGPPADTGHEKGLDLAIERAGERMRFCGHLGELVDATDGVIFVAVQTPHRPRHEGVDRVAGPAADFDYSLLEAACRDLSNLARARDKPLTLAVVSTVLPGTTERELWPEVDAAYISLVYNPSFIAMGNTIADFYRPEFVLLGGGGNATDRVAAVYDRAFTLPPPMVRCRIAEAELVKLAYNTFIGQKIVFANALMEVIERGELAADVDVVTRALGRATKRLISPAYLQAGMGDGGACHPRDNIALSWLADQLDLSYDLFGQTMRARERQAEWLVERMIRHLIRTNLPLGLLGYAYKPDTHLAAGSSARLVETLLGEEGIEVAVFDRHTGHDDPAVLAQPRVWLHATDHSDKPEVAPGSVVVDPFRNYPALSGVVVDRLGAR